MLHAYFHILRSEATGDRQKILWKGGMIEDVVCPPGLGFPRGLLNLY